MPVENKGILSIFALLTAPKRSWEKLSLAENANKESMLVSTLFPIAGIAALVVFISNISFTAMRADSGLESSVKMSAIAFIQFLATYYVASYIAVKIFGKLVKKEMCEVYISFITSATIFFYIAEFLLPDYTVYIATLSLYVVYIAWQGSKYYLKIGDDTANNRFTASISAIVLILPAVISILLRIILLK